MRFNASPPPLGRHPARTASTPGHSHLLQHHHGRHDLLLHRPHLHTVALRAPGSPLRDGSRRPRRGEGFDGRGDARARGARAQALHEGVRDEHHVLRRLGARAHQRPHRADRVRRRPRRRALHRRVLHLSVRRAHRRDRLRLRPHHPRVVHAQHAERGRLQRQPRVPGQVQAPLDHLRGDDQRPRRHGRPRLHAPRREDDRRPHHRRVRRRRRLGRALRQQLLRRVLRVAGGDAAAKPAARSRTSTPPSSRPRPSPRAGPPRSPPRRSTPPP